MALINSFISWLMQKRMHQIELFLKYPHDVQAEWLWKLINSAQNTEWGRKYDYKTINNRETFKQRVPVQTYEDLKPYIERMMRGEQNILWNSEITWFSKSSGTTADKSKFIPVSEEALEECHYKGGKDMLSFYCNNYPDTEIFNGKSLMMGGSLRVNEYNADARHGDISAIIMSNLPNWVDVLRTPTMDIALMSEWEAKIEKMAEETIKEDVTTISGVPSWTLVLLKRILEKTGKKSILEVWPNLELFMHGAVSFEPYREQYKQLIPSQGMHYLETYNASEGFFGIQDQKESGEMLLMLDYGIFYEFMPFEEIGKDDPKTLSLEQVEIGKNYAVIISTNAGLWRYLIGDTVSFTSTHPYRIHITGRTKHFINAFGEEIIIDNAEKALQVACQKTGAIICEYTAGPIYFSDDSAGAHEWLIEFEKEPESLDYFTDVLDNALKSVNSDYEAKRHKGMTLQMPKIHNMPRGTFHEWLRSKGKLGGQFKVPRLANDRKYLDEILAMKQ